MSSILPISIKRASPLQEGPAQKAEKTNSPSQMGARLLAYTAPTYHEFASLLNRLKSNPFHYLPSISMPWTSDGVNPCPLA